MSYNPYFMPTFFYKEHYRKKIKQHFTNEEKLEIANRISQLTLSKPIWLDRDVDYSKTHFPELKPYINTVLSGLYLCAIMEAILEDLQNIKD